MWIVRRFHKQILKPLPLLQNRGILFGDLPLHSRAKKVKLVAETNLSSIPQFGWTNGIRFMSTIRGRSMRSKVEKRMQRETGKTLREVRRAKKLRKKLMTEEERLIYNLRRAKKKVALLLQKLKKYELPELPAPRHDPELLTPEQLQAYKKIGFRNRNYVPVGVRGVFGGVVQNMHLHWKFHETVQVCCDNFPKEKIREMATMLARLSGGIVVNIHNVKTIIMFRGRNYRQPKNLIPINTLTKRKALFKARFEQALDSQKLNIKKIEQQLRRKGVNPEDPIAMASIQRVASTFFRAIDERQGTPYVFHKDRQQGADGSQVEEDDKHPATDLSPEDSDQEDLDRFIAEIEDAADQEWAAEEAAEREESSRIRYWGREGGKDEMDLVRGRSPNWRNVDSEDNRMSHGSKQRTMDIRKWNSGDEISEPSENEELEDSDNDMDGRRSHRNKQRTTNIRKWDSGDEISGPSENEEFEDSDEDSCEMMVVSAKSKKHEAYKEDRGGRSRKISSSSDSEMFGGGGSEEDELWRSDGDEDEVVDGGRNKGRTGDESKKKKFDDSWDSD